MGETTLAKPMDPEIISESMGLIDPVILAIHQSDAGFFGAQDLSKMRAA
jgi:hypothetical protein